MYIALSLRKTTKGTHVYEATTEGPIRTLYIEKRAAERLGPHIRLTVESAATSAVGDEMPVAATAVAG